MGLDRMASAYCGQVRIGVVQTMNPYDLLHRAQQTPGLTQTQKGVLIALLTFADANGWAWPSMDTIAEYVGVKERAVQRAMTELVASGIVVRNDRTGATCRFQVRFDKLSERRGGCPKSTPVLKTPPYQKHPFLAKTSRGGVRRTGGGCF